MTKSNGWEEPKGKDPEWFNVFCQKFYVKVGNSRDWVFEPEDLIYFVSQAILSAEEAKVREAAQIVRSYLLMSWATEEDVYEEIETIAKKIDSLSLPDQEQLEQKDEGTK